MKFLILLLTLSTPSFAAEAFKKVLLLPPEQSILDASFADYRRELLQAVEKRDANALLALTAENIDYSFGGSEPNKESFAREMNLNDPHSPFWSNLKTVMDLGCVETRAHEEVQCPYVFASWPDGFDGFSDFAVVKRNARLYKKPNESSKVIRKLELEIVRERASRGTPSKWLSVLTHEGAKGFVKRDAIRSPIDYRAFFTKKDDHWLMNIFIAGD